MKPVKYNVNHATKIDLGTKLIYKYPTPTKQFDIAHMVLNGRHPKEKNSYILEHGCMFAMFIIKGNGTVYAGDEIFTVYVDDVVVVPTDNKFAVEGNMEYITFDLPAYYPEQSEEIKSKQFS